MADIDSNKYVEKSALDTLSENLLRLLKLHNTNESELASRLNITYNTIHRLVAGTTTDPKLSTLQQIAEHFDISLDTLLSNSRLNPRATTDTPHLIPVLSWENIQTLNFFNTFNSETWTKWIPVVTTEKNMINGACYALESTRSMQPRFPIGTTFIVKPLEPPVDGDIVLVRFAGDQSVSLRELMIDSPEWQLHPTIPGSKSLVLERGKVDIIGVVILTLIQPRKNS